MSVRLRIGSLGALLVCMARLTGSSACAAEPTGKRTSEDLDVRYAQTLLDLSQARLKRIREWNLRVPGTVSQASVESLMLEVQAAREVVQRARQDGKLDWFPFVLRLAEAAYTVAESEWKRGEGLRQRSPEVVSELDLKILRLRAELAWLNLARGRELVSAPPEEQRSWAVEMLFVEVKRLHDKTLKNQYRD